MSNAIFISGTGFGCGKSLFSAILARAFLQKNRRVGYLNIIETILPGITSSTDMVKWITRGYSSSFNLFNALNLRKKCSPHLALELEAKKFDFESIEKKYSLLAEKNDFVIIDTPGNVLTNLTRFYTNADMATDLNLSTIVVVPNNISTIANLAVEAEALFARGVKIIGCVLNNKELIDPIIADDNKKTIEDGLQIRIIAEIPFIEKFKVAKTKIPHPLYILSKSLSENNLKSFES